jgi:hypothetical protein
VNGFNKVGVVLITGNTELALLGRRGWLCKPGAIPGRSRTLDGHEIGHFANRRIILLKPCFRVSITLTQAKPPFRIEVSMHLHPQKDRWKTPEEVGRGAFCGS